LAGWSHSLPINDRIPTLPLEQDLLKRPWGRNKKYFNRFQLYQERILLTLGGAIFTVLLTWQSVNLWYWQQAIKPLQTQIEELRENISPILSARTKALAEKKKSEQLLALDIYPSQLELITQVAEKLPQKNTILIEWFYQTGELRFILETNQLDPTFYVKTFQKNPLFKDVNAKPGTGRSIRLRVGLWFIIVLSLSYIVLLLNDYQETLQQEHQNTLKRLNQLQNIAHQNQWLERASQTQALRTQLEVKFWQANTSGLAQATFQKWLDTEVHRANMKKNNLRILSALELPKQPNIWKITARLDANFTPQSLHFRGKKA